MSGFDRRSVGQAVATVRAVRYVRNSGLLPYAGVMQPTRDALEKLLRVSRPLPQTEFVRELEDSLLRSLETRCFAVDAAAPATAGRRLVKKGRDGRPLRDTSGYALRRATRCR
jgi:hypothetical protein